MLDDLYEVSQGGRTNPFFVPSYPIKIIGPRGSGKTTLLNWARREAKKLGIRFVSCEGLRKDGHLLSMQKLLADIKGRKLPPGRPYYKDVVEPVLRKKPLLLLLDKAQHYDRRRLVTVLQSSQPLLQEGYPLGIVLTGTPELDRQLSNATKFFFYCKWIYIDRLSDKATRAALAEPFERMDVKVTPGALRAMAAQTDNHPYFIQMAGKAAWDAMEEAGRVDVDARLVRRIEKQMWAARERSHEQAYGRIVNNDLLPQARQVIDLFVSNGGRQIGAEGIIDALQEANPGMHHSRAREIRTSLQEDGLIWTEDFITKPGIPSFFNYCKDRLLQREDSASSRKPASSRVPRNILHYFDPSTAPSPVDPKQANPFRPGPGRAPPLLAGREKEVKVFEGIFQLLLAPRGRYDRMDGGSPTPVRIVASRGVGRRALLSWVEGEARQRGIRVARCSCPDPKDAGGNVIEPVLAAIMDENNGWVCEAAEKLLRKQFSFGAINRRLKGEERSAVYHLMRELPAKERLLLIVDDVQHYYLESLCTLLQMALLPLRQGYPFALVLAGNSLMDAYLNRIEDSFIDHSERLYLGELSDAATREALLLPFEQAGVKVMPKAVDAMAAQAANYPRFIQTVGREVWEEMAKTGRKSVFPWLVRQTEGENSKGREAFYAACYEQLENGGLLPYARQAMELIEDKGGSMTEGSLLDALKESNPEVDQSRGQEIRNGLLEAGFIWAAHGHAEAGIPGFFSYFKTRISKQ